MAYQDDIALMAHLMRRAGFGATRDEAASRRWAMSIGCITW